jgi:putative (di)nucleoside polyphosphate hydrolase
MTRANLGGESFRAGVGIVVHRDDGRLLAMERGDVPGAWQLPQGGLMPGEDTVAAAWRELAEETGLTQTHVDLAAVSDGWFGYELPHAMRSLKTGRGQVHRWFLFRLKPGVELPLLPNQRRREFKRHQWITVRELIDISAPFRRGEYELVKGWLGDQC